MRTPASRTIGPIMNAPDPNPPSPTVAAARRVLAEVFGYPAFRGQQQDIVEQVIDGGDALVLMPTGGGKACATRSRRSCVTAPARGLPWWSAR